MTDELAAGMSRLAGLLLASGDLTDSLAEVGAIVTRMLPGKPMVGIIVVRAGAEFVGGTVDLRRTVLAENRIRDLGPARQTLATGLAVSAPDLDLERRWPDHTKQLRIQGIRSVFTQPLVIRSAPVGALVLYATERNGFGATARHAAELTADHIGVLLALALTAADRAAQTEQLHAALASRSTIDQALGIMMARFRCSRDDAFDRLRGISQHRNVKVAALAAEIIEAVTGNPPGPVHFEHPRGLPRR
ncbi:MULTISPECIES: GAF and ANTAR domain-containing protein [unclassified Nocardia]|uniref:GAF and ANTAR domain-containing protein n=1 Tax=unclassified Nocardia TaxID=2637762 RepID=UPI001CE3C48E|nr:MULTISPECIES: GAF and ANTAR domain-containing protein [unclassified Nocardia]